MSPIPDPPLNDASETSEQCSAACFTDTYELCSVLRGGSLLTEYLVKNTVSGEKFLCVELDYTNLRHFNKEFCLAKLMSFVGRRHPNHLTYREFFSNEDAFKVQIIMEPYINKCLYDVIDQICKGKLTLSDEAVWGIIAQVFNGLYFYQQTDLNGFCGKTSVHGGINAENVYISTSGIVQLGPFRLLSDGEEEIDNTQESNEVILPTSPGSAEQNLRSVSDFQALGCIVYEITTGKSLTRDDHLQYYTPMAVQEAKDGLQTTFVTDRLLQFTVRLLSVSVSSTAQLLQLADTEELLINIDFSEDVIAARNKEHQSQVDSLLYISDIVESNTHRNISDPESHHSKLSIHGPIASEGIAYFNDLIQAALEPILMEQHSIKDELQVQKELVAKLQEYNARHEAEIKVIRKDISVVQKAVLKLTTGEHKEKVSTSRATSSATRSGIVQRSQTISTRPTGTRLSSARSPTKSTKSPRISRTSDADANSSTLVRSSVVEIEDKKTTSELKRLRSQMTTLMRQLSSRDEDILELQRRLEDSYQMLSSKEGKNNREDVESLQASALSTITPMPIDEDEVHYIKFVCLPCNHLIVHKVKENRIHLHSCPKCSGGISNLIVVTDE